VVNNKDLLTYLLTYLFTYHQRLIDPLSCTNEFIQYLCDVIFLIAADDAVGHRPNYVASVGERILLIGQHLLAGVLSHVIIRT